MPSSPSCHPRYAIIGKPTRGHRWPQELQVGCLQVPSGGFQPSWSGLSYPGRGDWTSKWERLDKQVEETGQASGLFSQEEGEGWDCWGDKHRNISSWTLSTSHRPKVLSSHSDEVPVVGRHCAEGKPGIGHSDLKLLMTMQEQRPPSTCSWHGSEAPSCTQGDFFSREVQPGSPVSACMLT